MLLLWIAVMAVRCVVVACFFLLRLLALLDSHDATRTERILVAAVVPLRDIDVDILCGGSWLRRKPNRAGGWSSEATGSLCGGGAVQLSSGEVVHGS